MFLVQIVSADGVRLKTKLKERERDLRRKEKGTFYRSAEGKWKHKRYPGWIEFKEGVGRVLTVKIQSREERDEWQLLQAYIGFLARTFKEKINSISISFGH